jgi:hypothetical protein
MLLRVVYNVPLMSNGILSRRDFLKLSGAALLAALTSELRLETVRAAPVPFQGRVQAGSLVVRDAPAFSGHKLRSFKRDTLFDVLEVVYGGVDEDYNRRWYRVGAQSYVYSGWVQTVSTTTNQLVTEIPETGVLGEITAPYTISSYGINGRPSPGPRLYFASCHWITDLVVDKRDGSRWYKVHDEAIRASYYIPTPWVHIYSPEELAPLSPQVAEDNKHIEVNLDRQLLLAYEEGVPVYAARVATGQKNYETPTGWFRTFHKRPTYHMFGGADEASLFDLPGTPWDTYITDNGVALHGTYWHNDFGHTHSHGCINLRPEDAKWVFRWTLPTVPPDQNLVFKPGTGTRVLVTQS